MWKVPRGLGPRAVHLGRVAGSSLIAGSRRLLGDAEAADRAWGAALVGELDQMKGMAMKVGQILSYLDGAAPPGVQEALGRLQRGDQATPWSTLVPVVEAELGAPVHALFDSVDPHPIAAASIGQVHQATLNGQRVALKVQYPGVRETLEADVQQLRRIAGLASLATRVDGGAIVADLEARLLEECDYAHEAAAQRRFHERWSGEPGLRIPGVVADRSSGRVLTTTWEDGASFSAFGASASPQERSDAARTCVRFALRSLLVHGEIHADPHPGNLLFRRGQVVVLDFGCVRSFTPRSAEARRARIRAILEGDRPAYGRALVASGIVDDLASFDLERHLAMDRWIWEPYLTPRYTFDRSWAARGEPFNSPSNPNLRRMHLPPEEVWVIRLMIGLHAVLGRLGAEGAFAAELLEHLDPPRHEAA